MDLPLGIIVFLTVVVPWYVLAEARNPGYLRYFLVEEHLLRFSTSHFQRTEPWYFFIPVLIFGFFPWTGLLPAIMRGLRKQTQNQQTLFLLLWTAVPFVFFSLSASKLPHYILPILPPLSIIVGAFVAESLPKAANAKSSLWLPPLGMTVLLGVIVGIIGYPYLLPQSAQQIIQEAFPKSPRTHLWGLALLSSLTGAMIGRRAWPRPGCLYLLHCGSFALLVLFVEPVMQAVADFRSSKELAAKSASLIPSEARVAIYEGYLASLPFYLKVDQPIIVVSSRAKHRIMASRYVAEKKPAPAEGHKQVLFSHEEFRVLWTQSAQPLFVFVHTKDIGRFAEERLVCAEKVIEVQDVALIRNGECP
jgi:4-amino-4-deoxy-L-arabinose transferase-like glycosyltransferase